MSPRYLTYEIKQSTLGVVFAAPRWGSADHRRRPGRARLTVARLHLVARILRVDRRGAEGVRDDRGTGGPDARAGLQPGVLQPVPGHLRDRRRRAAAGGPRG